MKQSPPHKAQVFLDETEIGQSTPAFLGSDKIIGKMNEALVPVWQGQKEAARAIHEVLPQIEEIIAQARAQR
jgi:hypothetical protein